MQKISLVVIALGLLTIISCKKEPQIANTLPVGEVPSSFSQKVLIEESTGEWCGWCPEGAEVLKQVIASNPSKIIGVAVHDNDPFEVSSYNDWQKTKNKVVGYPMASIQRAPAIGRGSWQTETNKALNVSPKCGLAIQTKLENGSLLHANVFVGFNQSIDHNTNLTVLIIEDRLPQSSPGAQSDYTSQLVDNSWRHEHVVRGILTQAEGDPIQLTDTENKYKRINFANIDLSTMGVSEPSNCKLVAFVNVNDGINSVHNFEVLNVQSASLNEIKKWD